MESFIQREANAIYDKLLRSRVLFQQLGQIEFATQPKEMIYRENKLLLYHYQPKVKKPAATPLLIVFALINRPDILDFTPDISFIRGLLEAGRDVYLLDWGYPSPDDRDLSLSHYITGYLRNCVEKIKTRSGRKQIDLLGICQGGVLSLCYAGLFPRDLRRLVLISTPVDFHTPEDILSRLVRRAPVDAMVKKLGNIPGASLAAFFAGIRPFSLHGKKYLSLLDQLSRPQPDLAWLKRFFLVEKWLRDTPDLAGRAFSQFIQLFYYQNALLQGPVLLDNERVDLGAVTMPVLNVIARDDHIVPPRATRALARCLPRAAQCVRSVAAGHIGIYISEDASRRVPKMIASWLDQKDARTGGRDNGRRSQNKRTRRKRRVGQ